MIYRRNVIKTLRVSPRLITPLRRMVRHSRRLLSFVLAAGLAKSVVTLAQTAVPTSVDFPGSDGTRAYGIDKAGDIVGTYELRDPAVVVHSHGVYAKGRFSTWTFRRRRSWRADHGQRS